MKILFLHLSDAHLKDNTDLRLININGIVNSLTQIGDFDECVLVFSGDVANSGEKMRMQMLENLWVILLKASVKNILMERLCKPLLFQEIMII